ncbi:MAG: YaaL family protein [Defluviitaleaceae bacterium]|nr:YaaL family protein [Defluviitaleaceae bacterium]
MTAENMYQAPPRTRKIRARSLKKEDIVILAAMEKLRLDLDRIHRSLDAVTDPDLIDSFVYELNAVNMRYKFYLTMCKEKGLVSAMF